MKLFLLMIIICLITACTSGVYEPTVQELASADYGAKPRRDSIPNFIYDYYRSSDSYDPQGVLIEGCEEAIKAWQPEMHKGYEIANSVIYGWQVRCSFNAKDDSGEFIGAVSENYFIKDDQVIYGYVPLAYKPLFR